MWSIMIHHCLSGVDLRILALQAWIEFDCQMDGNPVLDTAISTLKFNEAALLLPLLFLFTLLCPKPGDRPACNSATAGEPFDAQDRKLAYPLIHLIPLLHLSNSSLILSIRANDWLSCAGWIQDVGVTDWDENSILMSQELHQVTWSNMSWSPNQNS